MGYLKRDGTPRRIPKRYWGKWAKVNEKVKPKAKKSNVEDIIKMHRNYKKSCKLRAKAGRKTKRDREIMALETALNTGTLDQIQDMMVAVKEAGLGQKLLYDKDGTVIPVHNHAKDYDPELADVVLERMRDGDTVQILQRDGVITLNKFRKWYRSVPEFKKNADAAEIERTGLFYTKIQDLMGEVERGSLGTKEATFIADQCKWILERLNPKFMRKDGKQELNVNVNDDGKVQFQIMLASSTAPQQIGQDDGNNEAG